MRRSAPSPDAATHRSAPVVVGLTTAALLTTIAVAAVTVPALTAHAAEAKTRVSTSPTVASSRATAPTWCCAA
ncbi:hypothetical protein NKG05_13000 [Oerskovia sp. M15]